MSLGVPTGGAFQSRSTVVSLLAARSAWNASVCGLSPATRTCPLTCAPSAPKLRNTTASWWFEPWSTRWTSAIAICAVGVPLTSIDTGKVWLAVPATGLPSAAATALSTVAVTCASADPGCVSCGIAIVIGTVVATCGSSWIASSPNASHDAAAVPRFPVASVAESLMVRRRFAVWFDTTRSCSSDAPGSRVTASPEPATCASDSPTASAGTEAVVVAAPGAPGSAATGRAATTSTDATPARSATNRLMSEVLGGGARSTDHRGLIGQTAR